MSILRIFVTVVKCLLSRFEQKESFLVPLEKGSYPLLKTFDTQSKPSKKCVKHDIFCIHNRIAYVATKYLYFAQFPKFSVSAVFAVSHICRPEQKSDKSKMQKK